MIRNIIYSFLIFDLILALSILVFWWSNGIAPHTIRFGSSFMSFFKSVSQEFTIGRIQIPRVPELNEIPYLSKQVPNWVILNFLVFLFNSTLNFLNVLIFFVNCILDALRFFTIIFGNFNNLIDILKTM